MRIDIQTFPGTSALVAGDLMQSLSLSLSLSTIMNHVPRGAVKYTQQHPSAQDATQTYAWWSENLQEDDDDANAVECAQKQGTQR